MMEKKDVVILGGGPAGAAAAITLCRYTPFSVLVVERSDYSEQRIGETLSPGIQGLLRYLNVWDPFASGDHQPSYGSAATWGSDLLQVRDFLLSPFGSGWHLDRQQFDRMLAQEVNGAGSIWTNAKMVDHHFAGDGWKLRVDREGQPVEVCARYIIDASGKFSRFARSMGARRRITDHLAGVAGMFRFAEQIPEDTLTLVEPFESGWWYSSKLPDRSILVALMSDSDLIRKSKFHLAEVWKDTLAQTNHTMARLKGGKLNGGLKVHPAYSAFLENPVGKGWLAAGDAAASYDPLSSSGIPRALDSGISAAIALNSFLREGSEADLLQYQKKIHDGFRVYHETKLRYYRMERRWPNEPFWQRRHEDSPQRRKEHKD